MADLYEHPRMRHEPWRPGPLGRLWLLELLGRSERSAAWLVADNRTEARYLLFTPAAPSWPSQALTRWAARMAAVTAVGHPALARCIRAGHHDGRPYVLYDLADWQPLPRYLQAGAVLPGDALALGSDASAALGALHDAGLVHGDPQPWAMLVSPDGARCMLAGASVGAVGPTEGGRPDAAPTATEFEAEVLAFSSVLDDCFSGVATTLPRAPLQESVSLNRLVWPVPPDVGDPGCPRSARRLTARLLSQRERCVANGQSFLGMLVEHMTRHGVLPPALDPDPPKAELDPIFDARLDEAASLVVCDIALVLAVLVRAQRALADGRRSIDSEAVPSLPDAMALVGLDGVMDASRALHRAAGTQGREAERHPLRERTRHAADVAARLRLPGSPEHLARLAAALQGMGRQVVAYHMPDAARLVAQRAAALVRAQPVDRIAPAAAERSAAVSVLGVDLDKVTAVALRQAHAPPGMLLLAQRWHTREAARWRSPMQVTALCGSLANDIADIAELRADLVGLPDPLADALAWKYMALLDEHPRPAHELLREAFAMCREAQIERGRASSSSWIPLT